jgi:hypothetical protein
MGNPMSFVDPNGKDPCPPPATDEGCTSILLPDVVVEGDRPSMTGPSAGAVLLAPLQVADMIWGVSDGLQAIGDLIPNTLELIDDVARDKPIEAIECSALEVLGSLGDALGLVELSAALLTAGSGGSASPALGLSNFAGTGVDIASGAIMLRQTARGNRGLGNMGIHAMATGLSYAPVGRISSRARRNAVRLAAAGSDLLSDQANGVRDGFFEDPCR